MAIVKVSWSGGKDSSCATHLHILKGNKVKAVCYIPMFTDDIPLISKQHYEFILSTADRFRDMGAEVFIVKGMTYYDFIHKRSSRGKFKGRAFGFPCYLTGRCNFKTYSKTKALNDIDVGYYEYEDIGIAYDETDRHNQLNEHKRSILVEREITEQKAFEYDKQNSLLSPHYIFNKRDGCALCPHKNERERLDWYSEYPEAKDIVIELQEFVKIERPDQTPLRNGKWFIEV